MITEHCVDLWYPRLTERTEDQPTVIRVGLVDVRAADDILIDFDFDRNGYRIRMETGRDPNGEETRETQLVEVAFVPAQIKDCE